MGVSIWRWTCVFFARYESDSRRSRISVHLCLLLMRSMRYNTQLRCQLSFCQHECKLIILMQGVYSMSDFNTSAAPTSETRGLAWRLSIWAGIIGPILYTLVFTLDGAFRPGYSAINVAVSFLRWRSAVITAGWRRAVTALLVLSVLGFVMAALFLPDPVGDLQLSVHAMLHEIAFTLVFLPLVISW